MLHINDLHYRIAGRPLFTGATCHIPAGHKVGLVGVNGSGKSTLLRLITGDIAADQGGARLRPDARLGHVMQEIDDTSQTLINAVLAADTERTHLLARADGEDDGHVLGEIHTRLADIDAHGAPARAARILAGLGFSEAEQNRPLASFSGGWRMRVALAAMLFAEPDLLLLDEPTNYLDLEGVMWLEHFLKRYPRTVITVSHDRDILNSTVDAILHLHDGKLTLYRGGYDSFERQRRERNEQLMANVAKQEEQRRHMQAFVDRFRYSAKKAKMAQSRLKAIARLEPIAAIVEDHTTAFTFPNPDALSPPLIALDHVSVGYEAGKPILSKLNQRLDMDDRIALLGANGNGKSTYAKLIAGRLSPMAGEMRQSRKLKIGYFAQHQVDELRENESALDHLQALMEDAPEQKVRARLGQFGFGAEKVETPAGALSGGEKARLLFALVTFSSPHLLILDEPTNHLDVDSREALIHAINAYEGAVILISHDRHLLNTCADRLMVVDNGTVTNFDGDMDDYRSLLLEQRAGRKRRSGKAEEAPAPKAQRKSAAQHRAQLKPMKDKAKQAEETIAKATKRCAQIDNILAMPNIWTEHQAKAEDLAQEKSKLEAAIAKWEEQWLVLQERIEAAENA
ncbi:MAG: ABC-F family ATP-binding cassette domain-containing protein [Alphaproteobacteria bacterium]